MFYPIYIISGLPPQIAATVATREKLLHATPSKLWFHIIQPVLHACEVFRHFRIFFSFASLLLLSLAMAGGIRPNLAANRRRRGNQVDVTKTLEVSTLSVCLSTVSVMMDKMLHAVLHCLFQFRVADSFGRN